MSKTLIQIQEEYPEEINKLINYEKLSITDKLSITGNIKKAIEAYNLEYGR